MFAVEFRDFISTNAIKKNLCFLPVSLFSSSLPLPPPVPEPRGNISNLMMIFHCHWFLVRPEHQRGGWGGVRMGVLAPWTQSFINKGYLGNYDLIRRKTLLFYKDRAQITELQRKAKMDVPKFLWWLFQAPVLKNQIKCPNIFEVWWNKAAYCLTVRLFVVTEMDNDWNCSTGSLMSWFIRLTYGLFIFLNEETNLYFDAVFSLK